MTQPQITLILGGARSGKSHHAEKLAAAQGEKILYIATAQALDDEMQQRIQRHQQERPPTWHTLEAAQHPAAAVHSISFQPDAILLDCITLLVSNILLSYPEEAPPETISAAVNSEIDALLHTVGQTQAPWFIVSNEIGLSLVSPYALGRKYTDLLGRANQRLAAAADKVLFMVAGIPLQVK